MIRLNNVTHQYVGMKEPIVRVDTLSLKKGERVALLGPSGSGKSTLLHMISGIFLPTTGEVTVDGYHFRQMKESERDAFRAQSVGYIFQDFHLVPSLTAKENIELVGTSPRLSEWFQRVGLKGKEQRYPHELSRGEAQRVAMIRAFIHEPSLILADEPTGSLDRKTGENMMHLLHELTKEEKVTFLCVTHDESFAETFPRLLQMTPHEKGGMTVQ